MNEEVARTDRRVLEVPATVTQLAAVRAFVRDSAARFGAPATAIGDVVQAVDECVTNAIEHGYKGREGTVQVELARDGPDLVVWLRDAAPPFDPTSRPLPDVTLPLSQRPLGGLGVFLARDLTDEMRYRQTAQGNELILRKRSVVSEQVQEVPD
jgi:serine/threonine-protein kinase RsbW